MPMALFSLPAIPDVPVKGENDGYAVARIFCVGRNYAAHAAEMGNEVPEAPFYFTKSPAHLHLSGATLPYPPGTEDCHHEVELVVALGAPLFRATPEEAAAAIYAYGCGLDMTRRDLQISERKKQRPWDLGKDFDGGAIIARLTKASEFTPATQTITLDLDGTRRQGSTLDLMLNDVVQVLCHLSGFYRLAPGDLIYTGTPEGVGPVVPGNHLSGQIEGLDPVELTITDPE
ncbi:fumarylacetoacetate hydrolase family protein [Pseudooceanicola sp. CBS1P-1]|uniref:FAA hydrolase family protein n=1 Tax=Pseudooceanicola albus TaxID=2692189 RepID=A0A6L7G960_9RHOB|nr:MULTISPECIES: fumarylacetoacetate hydrolase family protein [Pseudooceanicola]MBT9384060.1 fumarylacetoacetate hydrolase family protein [Pseudooceanicola endophyticus]MXN19840.1 FAA hydrolase family protein [Pseudooceanicola albus]